jgi:hypothetical protein
MADTERIFGYRALRFARGDATPLPGFEENDYMRTAEFDHRTLRDLLGEFEHVRRSHMHLFGGLSAAAWSRIGQASGNTMSVRALAYTMVGHARHHTAILKQRLGRA